MSDKATSAAGRTSSPTARRPRSWASLRIVRSVPESPQKSVESSLSSIGREPGRQNVVRNQDRDRALNDGPRRRDAHTARAARCMEALAAGNGGDQEPEDAGLDLAHEKILRQRVLLGAGNENTWIDVQPFDGHEPSPRHADAGGDHAEKRHHEDGSDEAGRQEGLNRAHAHRRDRVDLLRDAHVAQLPTPRTAGPRTDPQPA